MMHSLGVADRDPEETLFYYESSRARCESMPYGAVITPDNKLGRSQSEVNVGHEKCARPSYPTPTFRSWV